MNKKIIIFTVLILSVLSILAISVWGTLPESNNRPSVVSLTILDYTIENFNGDKITSVKDIVTADNYIFEFRFLVNPTDSNSQIRVRTDQEGITARVDDFESKVYVIFNVEKIGTTVTITIWDKNTQITDQVTLMFLPPSEIIIDDPDIF